ncbi:unnamed protein product [Orchesella dallaii]|uniref:Chitin-binding type-2 domain-containing protein n=1 Tax=Orchesella dallaii TaxID=48710 RepID=A0ABP1Q7U8_9HEXA
MHGGSTILAFSNNGLEPEEPFDIARLQPVNDLEHYITKDFPRMIDCGPDETQNWYEPDAEDCSCYFVCTGTYYMHRRCGQGLVFDPDSEQCNWPDLVNCGERPLPWSYPDYNHNSHLY